MVRCCSKEAHKCFSKEKWNLEFICTSRKKERLQKNLDKIVRNDLNALNLTYGMAMNWTEWKSRIRLADPSKMGFKVDDGDVYYKFYANGSL